MSISEIEKRLAAVEAEVANLKAERAVAAPQRPIDTFRQISGLFAGDEAFLEAMRLGRQWRESQRPEPRKPGRNPKAKRK